MRLNKFLLLNIIFVFILVLCYFGKPKESIVGNGNLITDKRDLPDFYGLKVNGDINVLLKQDNYSGIIIEADKNISEIIKTDVRGGILRIYSAKKIKSTDSVKVYVSFKTIKNIKISGNGYLKGRNLINVDKLDILVYSAGDIDLGLVADKINIFLRNSGETKLSGKANELNALLCSSGNMDAFGLKVKKCRIRLLSRGNDIVYALENLDLTSASSGNIYYSGGAQILKISAFGTGLINKK